MKSDFNVAVVGATGLVGQELIKLLGERRFPMSSVRLFASDRSTGRRMFINHREVDVKTLTQDAFKRVDIAFFSAATEISRAYSPSAIESGAVVIDSSAAFRLEAEVPLVVPEVNVTDLRLHKRLVASANPSVVLLVTVLHPLHRINPIKRVIVSTYQSVSGTGAAAMEELTTQSRSILEGKSVIPHAYPHQIAFNVLPEVDVFMDDDYTKEEWKIIKETKKLMHAPDLAIAATCVRVPVYIGHSQSVTVDFTSPMLPEEARRILAGSPSVRLLDDPTVSLYPQPWSVVGTNDVYVGRIRRDVSNITGLNLWITADNLRKGAALNTLQIAEELIKQQLI